jgi:hypothetical protein
MPHSAELSSVMKVANVRAKTPKVVAVSTPYGTIKEHRGRRESPFDAILERSPYNQPFGETSTRVDIDREFLFARSLSTGLMSFPFQEDPKIFCSWECCKGYISRYACAPEHKRYLDMIVDIAAAGVADSGKF